MTPLPKSTLVKCSLLLDVKGKVLLQLFNKSK